MAKEQLSLDLSSRMEQEKTDRTYFDFSCHDDKALRKFGGQKEAQIWRPNFAKDIDRILYSPYYNRYTDKTQVFSLIRNDDITRRSLHVQLVSRIARNIGRLLGLNCDLIEAIALGHDLGHTPFGHAGERILDQLMQEQMGKRFMHNVHSVRVLDTLYSRNVSLQVLDGILCHNGELEQQEYRPKATTSFEELEQRMNDCYIHGEKAVAHLIPSTLEGCVVRISDMIAYLGKDRQDAITAKLLPNHSAFSAKEIGTANSLIINNLVVDLVTNSYGNNYLSFSPGIYDDLKMAKKENRERNRSNRKRKIRSWKMSETVCRESTERR